MTEIFLTAEQLSSLLHGYAVDVDDGTRVYPPADFQQVDG